MRCSSSSNKIGDRIDLNMTEQPKFKLQTTVNEEAKAPKFERRQRLEANEEAKAQKLKWRQGWEVNDKVKAQNLRSENNKNQLWPKQSINDKQGDAVESEKINQCIAPKKMIWWSTVPGDSTSWD